jgi:ribosomal protein S18 acetylase RimI-like enzyme
MILINDQRYLSDFIRLNEAWISHYFKLEDADRALAARPSKVIDEGGYIFTLLVDEQVAGVCALFNDGAGVFQLARMAVTPEFQGQGFGHALMNAALSKLKALGAAKVFLLTNKKLLAAIGLYKKHGFLVVSEEQHPVYARSDLVMEKILSEV